MRFLIRLAFVFLMLLPVMAQAQQDDKGFLTRTLQDALSGAGRTVDIQGFAGALSSQASLTRMTIADDEGIWLTLEDVTLDWNRSALLRGRLEVESLTAARLEVARLPAADEDALPDAEAAPFSLPDLPVAIRIETFSIDEIELGEPVIGEAARLSVTASARLNDDEATIKLDANRTDGKRGEFIIDADLQRGESLLDLMLRLSEGEEGIAARLLNIPNQPTVDLEIAGSGPLNDFTADVSLLTDGAPRLAGQVTLGGQTPRRAFAQPDRRVRADIGGDITALLAPRYREFFGEDVRLTLDALLESTGAVEVSDFTLAAQAAQLQGQVTLNQDSWPTLIDISGRIANPDGSSVLLPLSGDATSVETVDLRIDYNADGGDAIVADFDITGLALNGVNVGQTRLGLDGTLQGEVGRIGQFQGDVTFAARALAMQDQALAEAIGDAIEGRATVAYTEDQPVEISGLTLSGTDYALSGDAVIAGLETGLETQIDALLEAQDLSRFSALAGREVDGQARLSLKGKVVPLSGQFDMAIAGRTDDLATGIAQADAVLAGRTELSLQARRNETGTFIRDLTLQNAAIDLTGQAALRSDDSSAQAQFRLADVGLVVPQYDGPVTVTATATQDASGWRVDAVTDGPYDAALTAKGLVTGQNAAIDFTADIPRISDFAEGVEGRVRADGTLRQTADGWEINTEASGPYDVSARIAGLAAPALDVTFVAKLPDVQPLAPQFSGALEAEGRLRQTEAGFVIDTRASGPYGLRATVEGLATGPDMALSFDLSMPNVAPVAPGVSGPLSANGVVRQTPDGIGLQATAAGPYSAQARVDGVVTGPNANVSFDAFIPNIGALVDRVNGPLQVSGTARKAGNDWRVDTRANGPSGTQATVTGIAGADGNLNLDISGTAPLGLSRPFLAPRDLQGNATFDLTLNGPPALSSLSGTIRTGNATFTAPNLRLALQGIAADVQLGGNRARVSLNGSATNGGTIRAEGGITLTGSLPADISIALRDLVLIDPRLYRTSVSGDLRLAGPLTGGAAISGAVNVGETTVNVPSTGITTIGDIPPITHIGATRPVMATRRKAGIEPVSAGGGGAGGGGPGFGLNLQVNAPNRIFVRGRGLDAELGGGLRLTGTTNRIISAGRFDLLRGRLDILGQRFDLVEGSIQFQGDLLPFIRFVSATDTATGEVRIIVEGPADSPRVSFEATPDAPQDEVLAQLLFGRSVSEISAFQALQLANAVATLAGREGVGVISNLRDGFGLDDLDVTTTEDGSTAVRAGKYISENVYTDVTAASDGTGEVSLNIDITPNLKGKATLGSDGNSGIGIFFEKDY